MTNHRAPISEHQRAEATAAMCAGKDALTPGLARKIARRMRRKRKANVEPYRCPHCGEWHVGRPAWRKD